LWVYGQSNAVSPANSDTLVFSATGHVWVNDYYCDRVGPGDETTAACYFGTEMVQPTRDQRLRSNQTWIILGDLLYSLTGRAVRVHQYASGAKNTAQLWSDSLFRHGKAALRAHPGICAALWIQGESETDIPVEETHWFMRSIVDTTRVIRRELPWFVALDAGGRSAQTQLIAQGLVSRGPDIDSLRANRPDLFTQPTPDEFAGAGHQAHAAIWLNVLRVAKVCGL
jgi:hypothetical protein